MKVAIFIFLFFSSTFFAQSQDHEHWCMTAHKSNALLLNPNFQKSTAHSKEIREQEKLNPLNIPKGTIFKIPIVFHILHNGGNENVDESQIFNALDVINRDFRKQNADTASIIPLFKPIIGDVEIEFVLATKAPDGSCFRGYTRTYSPLTFQGDDGAAQVNAIRNGNDVFQGNWPSDKYLNIFVIADAGGAGGYTNYPNDFFGTDMYNGIWILHTQFGEIGTSGLSAGRSLTHECGHWLNLPHTWGSSNTPGLASNCLIDDGISDTPDTEGVPGGCPLTQNDCGPTANVQNYMDYALSCQSMFTLGQVSEMRIAIQSAVGSRNNLWTAQNLIDTGTDTPATICQANFSSDKQVVCVGSTVSFSDLSYNNVSGWNWTFPGGTPLTSTLQNPAVSYNTPGTYEVTLVASDGTGTASVTQTNFIKVLDPSINIPIHDGFEAYTSLSGIPEWAIVNPQNDVTFQIQNSVALSGTKCASIENYGTPTGLFDELVSRKIDLSTIDPVTESVTLSFRYAYKRRNNTDNDWLRVYLSNDCGDTWLLRKSLHANQLSALVQTNPYFPSSSVEWTTIHMTNVTDLFFTSDFQFKFAFESGGGNNFFLDDINIYKGAPSNDIVVELLENELINEFHLFPNPATNELNLRYTAKVSNSTLVSITDITGKILQRNTINSSQGSNIVSLNTSTLSSGVYFLRIESNGEFHSKKFIIK